MPGPEYYKERAEIFAALASSASNAPMARLYAWMAAEYLAKAHGEELSSDDVPAIIFVPRAMMQTPPPTGSYDLPPKATSRSG